MPDMTEDEAKSISCPHTPLRWQGIGGWEAFPDQCCASVHDEGGRVTFHQCAKSVVIRYGRLGYCKTHDPAAVLARRAARDAKWEIAQLANSRKWATERLGHDAIGVLRKIAAGHNDPRALAQELLEPFDTKFPPEPSHAE